MSGASDRANGRASGPILQSVFLAVLDHSGEGKADDHWKADPQILWVFSLRRGGGQCKTIL